MHSSVTESYKTLLEAALKDHNKSIVTCFGVALSLYQPILDGLADVCHFWDCLGRLRG